MMMPSSITRLVEAISKVIAAVKLAPLRNSDRASATAAYEQLDEAMPSPVATANVFGRSSPSSPTIVSRRTTACTIAARVKPRIRLQVTCQVMPPASDSACPIACNTSFTSNPCVHAGETANRHHPRYPWGVAVKELEISPLCHCSATCDLSVREDVDLLDEVGTGLPRYVRRSDYAPPFPTRNLGTSAPRGKNSRG